MLPVGCVGHQRKRVQDKQRLGQAFRHLGFSLVFIFSFVPSGVHHVLLCASTVPLSSKAV